MKLEEFNKKYTYMSDKERFNTTLDIWELPKDADRIYADCESYCRFVKNNVEGYSDWDYYYCKLNGIGHCILIKDDEVLDCNCLKPMNIETYTRIFNVTNISEYNWFVIFSKIAFAKIYTLFKR